MKYKIVKTTSLYSDEQYVYTVFRQETFLWFHTWVMETFFFSEKEALYYVKASNTPPETIYEDK